MFSSALKSFTSNISANYTVSPTPSSVSGAWKVYDAKKKNTGKAVSVFVFERKSLDSQSGGPGSRSGGSALRKLHDEVIARVKKESNALARLRHPSILELAEPIEETRSGGLMFATEPVTASLAGLLQDKDDQERAGGAGSRPSRFVFEDADGQKKTRELEIDELEIQKGLLQVAQGLNFLHESAGLVHGNVTPEAIYINAKVCVNGMLALGSLFPCPLNVIDFLGFALSTHMYILHFPPIHGEDSLIPKHFWFVRSLASLTNISVYLVGLENCWLRIRRATRYFELAKHIGPYIPFRITLSRSSSTKFRTTQLRLHVSRFRP